MSHFTGGFNWGCLWAAVLLGAVPANAFTPESPEVKKIVDRAVAYLETADPGIPIGERMLVALALFKARNDEHPYVKTVVQTLANSSFKLDELSIYEHGLALILLGEMQKSDYQPRVQAILDNLIERQKRHGGFGYDGRGGHQNTKETGDVSQTQYVVLGMWSAKQAGAVINSTALVKVCDWLLRVQDPSGGWGYQGKDPGEGSEERVKQTPPPTQSLSAAGLGSICICADLMGIHHQGVIEEVGEKGVPGALKVVKKPKAEQANKALGGGAISFARMDRAVNDGAAWFNQNYIINPQAWKFYYMYGLERSESFRELYTRKFSKEPKWYNDGVTFLGTTQQPNGAWEGDVNQYVSTSFSVLFLVRGTRKSIAKAHKDLGDGVLTSGVGLPTNLANATIKGGKIVDSPLVGEVNDLVSLLEDPDNAELLRLAESGNSGIKLETDLTKRNSQILKLREAVSAGRYEKRLVAVRALGQARDMDSVPMLLYALTDPDPRIIREADEALRFLSRKFRGVGWEGEDDVKSLATMRKAWREWYLSVRPDAELLD